MGTIIEARDLVKRFNGVTAVDHISFAVPEGVIFGFLGPNGVGKTTTIKILTTVLSPSEGRLMVAGHDPVKERRGPSIGLRHRDPAKAGGWSSSISPNKLEQLSTIGWVRSSHTACSRCGLLLALPGKSLKGHFEPFPPPRRNGRYPFS